MACQTDHAIRRTAHRFYAAHPSRINNHSEDESVQTGLAVGEYLENWLALKQPSIRLRTFNDYQRIIHKLIIPALGSIPINELNTGDVCQFYRQLGDQGMGSRAIHYTHSVLRVAFKDAIAQGLVEGNPTQGAILPRWEKREMQVLDEGQIARFLQTARNSPYYGIYHFAIATGMRMGEILGLKWGDVDWANAMISIRRQVQQVNGHSVIFQEPKTRAGIRRIKIQRTSLDELQRQKQRIEQYKQRKGDRWLENDLVFPSRVGTPVVANNMRRNFKAMLQRAGLPAIRFHDLRHTAATMMIAHEVPIIVVSQILGHSKPSVTLDVYSHCSVSMQTQASLIMDELVHIC